MGRRRTLLAGTVAVSLAAALLSAGPSAAADPVGPVDPQTVAPQQDRPVAETRGRNQHRASSGKPRVTWDPAKATLTAIEGSLSTAELTLVVTGQPGAVTARTSGGLSGVVSADADRITPLGDDRYRLPITLQVPADAKSAYSGAVQLRGATGNLGPALPITIRVLQPQAGVVGATAVAPSDDRLTDLLPGITVVRDELVVSVVDGATDPDAVALAAAEATGAVVHGSVRATRTYQLRYPGSDWAATERRIPSVLAVPGVRSAYENVVAREPLAAVPDDSEWDSWDNTPGGNNWAMESIRMQPVWDTTTGSSDTRVALIDADIDEDHSDLDDNFGPFGGRGASAGGHGTHVAGTICAEGDNDKGVSGVMWDCDLAAYPYGRDVVTTQAVMVQAADDGARAVNLSLQFVENNRCGTPGTASTERAVEAANDTLGSAILYAQRNDKDVLWVFAAGNECRDTRFASPGSLTERFPTNAIAVSSVQEDGELSDFSNTGELVDVAAPGSDIFSTVPRDCFFGLFCGDEYGVKSGTSMAAPHVTGLAGLLFSNDPDLTASEAKNCIVSGTQGGAEVPDHGFRVINGPASLRCKRIIDLPAQVDVVLSLDLTGSMGGVLDQAKAQVAQTVTDLKAVSPGTDFRFSVTSYEDYPGFHDSRPCGSSYSDYYGDDTDEPFRINQTGTDDPATVAAAVAGLQLGSGWDGPESYGRALWEVGQADTGATLGLRPGALKLLINFGDNVPHDENINEGVDAGSLSSDSGVDPGRNGKVDCGGDDIDFQDDALEALKSADVKLLHVDSDSNGSTETYWRTWAATTGGSYTQLARGDGRTLTDITLELLRLIPRD